jgi:indole-3-glycerol phosphate synthase
MTILEEIIAHKKRELSVINRLEKVRDLERSKLFSRQLISLTDYLLKPGKTGIIAEFKRRSPSMGIINSKANLEDVTTGYCRFGASGISILTDYKFFGGSNSDLSDARALNTIPILRKDFIIDEYQIIESKSVGADAILLIAAALEKNSLLHLARFARSLGLQVLLEVHNFHELNMINEYVNIIGVNNRDLKTFVVDIGLSERLAEKIPSGFVKISESGISSAFVLKNLRNIGYQGFLIGESFMSKSDPVAAFSDFVKLIGLRNEESKGLRDE